MIDSIKIILKDFSGDLKNCTLKSSRKLIENPDEKKYNNYRLPNRTKFDKHHLTIRHALDTNTVNVVGSLRKRAYHKSSFRDLDRAKFEQTIRKLAKELNITFDEIKKARFTNCEIGANINIRYSVKEALYMVVAYSTLKRDDERIDEGTLYFKGADVVLKLYAKDIEIAAKSHWTKQDRKNAAFARMRECGNNMLRIEFTIANQRAFNHHQMEHIKNVGDLIEHYHDLYDFWTREVARLIFFNQLDYSNTRITEKEQFIISGLEQYNFEWFVEEYKNRCALNVKQEPRDIKSAKSKAYKSICKILDKYYDRKAYNMYNLRVDIAKYFLRKSNSETLNLPLLLRNLWGVPSYNSNKIKK